MKIKNINYHPHFTNVLQGKGSTGDIEKRVSSLRDDIELTNSEYEKEKLSERLAKLASGVAVIKVRIVNISQLSAAISY